MASLNDIISLNIAGYSVPDEGDSDSIPVIPDPNTPGVINVNTPTGVIQDETSTGKIEVGI